MTRRFSPIGKNSDGGAFSPPRTQTALGIGQQAKTVNQLLTELVNHYLGKGMIPEGSALSAIAKNLPFMPTDAIVLFLAKPHSPWVEHVVALDPKGRELVLDQNPYLKTTWDRAGRYEALLPGGRVSTFVPLREISVDEIIRKGGIHYDIRKIQVDMSRRQSEQKKLTDAVRQVEQERQRHFWPMRTVNDPRTMRELGPETPVPFLSPMDPKPEERKDDPDDEPHFMPVPTEVRLPVEEKDETDPIDEDIVRKMQRIKEIDDRIEKDEEIEKLRKQLVEQREQEEDDEGDGEDTDDEEKPEGEEPEPDGDEGDDGTGGEGEEDQTEDEGDGDEDDEGTEGEDDEVDEENEKPAGRRARIGRRRRHG